MTKRESKVRAADQIVRLNPDIFGDVILRASDISLLIDTAGLILEVIYNTENKNLGDIEQWRTRNIRDFITKESGIKLEEILNKTYSLSQNGSDFSKNTEHELKGKSPTSLKITFKQIHMATEMSLRDALIMEYRMVQRCQASGDFYEGVRAMLVDKDRNPQWKPSNLDKVDEIWVNHFFEPLHEKDLKI